MTIMIYMTHQLVRAFIVGIYHVVIRTTANGLTIVGTGTVYG
jgi:hypothetical protein